MKIRRETRIAKERAEADLAFARQGELQMPPPAPGAGPASPHSAAQTAQVTVPAHAPVDAGTSFRRAQRAAGRR